MSGFVRLRMGDGMMRCVQRPAIVMIRCGRIRNGTRIKSARSEERQMVPKIVVVEWFKAARMT